MSLLLMTLAEEASRPSGLGDPLVLLALGAAGLLLLYVFIKRPGARDADRRAVLVPGAETESARQQRRIQALLAELDQAARQMSAQIDAKAARLEELVLEADAKMAALNGALAQTRARHLTQQLICGAHGAGEESGLAALSRHREIYDLADAGQSAQAIASKLSRPSGEVELILALRGSGA